MRLKFGMVLLFALILFVVTDLLDVSVLLNKLLLYGLSMEFV